MLLKSTLDIITGKKQLRDVLQEKEEEILTLNSSIQNLEQEKAYSTKKLNDEINRLQNEIRTSICQILSHESTIQNLKREICEKNALISKMEQIKEEERLEKQRVVDEQERIKNAEIDKYRIGNEEGIIAYDCEDLSDEDIFIKRIEKITQKSFNEDQIASITHNKEHLRIIAGAGSGKTETICAKAVFLKVVKRVDPKKICMITFTKKAGEEMKKRVNELSNGSCDGIVIGTFNAVFKDIVNEMIKIEQLSFLKDILILGEYKEPDKSGEGSNVEYSKLLAGLIAKYGLRKFEMLEGKIKTKIEYWTSLGFLNEEIREIIRKHYESKEVYNDIGEINLSEVFCEMLQEFEVSRKKQKIFVLNDQIQNLYKVTKYEGHEKQSISDFLENRFDYIFIDEFQDINSTQISIIKAFVPTEKIAKTKLVIVGDANQAIYMFRGSDSSFIQTFDKDYRERLDTIFLMTNYRSKRDTVLKANKLILNNYDKTRIPSDILRAIEMNPFCKAKEKSVTCTILDNKEDEAKYIISRILDEMGKMEAFKCEKMTDDEEKLVEKFTYLKSHDAYPNFTKSVVLFRSTHQVTELVNQLEKRKIPYIIEKDVDSCIANTAPFKRYFDDLFELYKSSRSEKDWDKFVFAFSIKIFAVDKKRITASEYEENYLALKSQKNYDIKALFNFLNRNKKKYDLSGTEKGNIEKYLSLVEVIISEKPNKVDLLLTTLMSLKGEEKAKEKWEDLIKESKSFSAFSDIVNEYEQAKDFRERREENQKKLQFYNKGKFNGVYLLTIHKSKGLTFDNTFIIGCTEDVFPSNKAVNEETICMQDFKEKAEPPSTLQEERRLMYVALTRARDKVVITSPSDNGKARSLFVSEILDKG